MKVKINVESNLDQWFITPLLAFEFRKPKVLYVGWLFVCLVIEFSNNK